MNSPIPLLDLAAQNGPLKADILAAIEAVIDSHCFIGGPQIAALEQEVAALCGCASAVGVSSGTDALLCTLMGLGIGPGDEVITTPYTFFATAGSIVRVGATPVFADIELDTFNLDPEAAAACLSSRTRAILPVHLFGQCCAMDALSALASARGLPIIEDAAQSIGALYRGQKAGSMGLAGCLSFFPSKNLGAMGDGGMIVTRDPALADTLVVLRSHGARPKYVHARVGGNFRLDTLQAAVLLVKLRFVERWTSARRANAALYDALLADLLEVRTPVVRPEAWSVYNQYVIRTERRDALAAWLKTEGIQTQVYYPMPLHLQACFAPLGYKPGDFPRSEEAARTALALPIFPELGEERLRRVAGAVRRFFRG